MNTPDAALPKDRPWSLPRKILFRWVVLYFVLFSLTAILQLVPIVGGIVGFAVSDGLRPVVVWCARAVAGVTISVFPNGSGDTTYNWFELAFFFALATVGTGLWSLVDRRRTSHPWVCEGFLIAMRFVLASAMLGYGVNKIFALQFPAPGMGRLLQNYGDSSPMGILWTFMGTSTAYTMAAGWMETIGGLLLLFRRTTLVGALWVAGVMANVVLLNLCYDVPVKIYSSHLFLTALIIAAPDLPRVAKLFVLNAPVEPKNLIGPWTKPWLRRSAFGVKLAWVLVTVPLAFWQNYQGLWIYGPNAPRGPLDGTWEVIELRRDGAEIPPIVTDATRWRYVTVTDRPSWKMLSLAKMKGPSERWVLNLADEPADGTAGSRGKLHLIEQAAAAGGADASAAKPVASLDYERLADGRLRISGSLAGARYEALCVRREPSEFLLLNRGFHWINETPFNR